MQDAWEETYILPSSIHETILMKDNGRCSSEKLHEIIADINRSQLREEEVLSDYAYFYDAVTGKVKEKLAGHICILYKKGLHLLIE